MQGLSLGRVKADIVILDFEETVDLNVMIGVS